MTPPVATGTYIVFCYLGGRVDVAVGNNRDVGVGSLCHRLKKTTLYKHISSVADPGCLSRIPDPDFYPSRIPDPKTVTKEVKKNLFYFFLKSQISQN
jgi:hypothetical protein